MKAWVVITKVYDDFTAETKVLHREEMRCAFVSFQELPDYDLYMDDFDKVDEAEAFAKEA